MYTRLDVSNVYTFTMPTKTNKRDELVIVRVTSAERDGFKRLAARRKVTISAFVRELVAALVESELRPIQEAILRKLHGKPRRAAAVVVPIARARGRAKLDVRSCKKGGPHRYNKADTCTGCGRVWGLS